MKPRVFKCKKMPKRAKKGDVWEIPKAYIFDGEKWVHEEPGIVSTITENKKCLS